MKNKLILSIFSFLTLLVLSGCSDASEEVLINEAVETVAETPSVDVAAIEDQAIEEATNGSNERTEEQDEQESEKSTEENPRDGPLEGLKVHFIDVGQADATLFEYSHAGEDFTILFDAGNWNRNDVMNYLSAHQINHIDILIGSHPHADHIGQMDQILNEIDVTEVWLSGDTATSQTYQRVLDAIETSGVSYHEPRSGEIFDVGPLEIQIINPDRLTGDVHEGSIAAKFTYGQTSFMLTGDAETQTERAMLSRGFDLEVDVLQLGHHGSSTSTIPEFLSAVNPVIAIVSAGENNQYGHPHDEVINRVRNAGIEIYATYVHGTIIIESDGQSLSILTKEDGTVSPSSSGGATTASAATSSSGSDGGSGSLTVAEMPTNNCIDINSASESELQGITHIGATRAREVVQLRPFSSINDMARINGIAAGRLADIIEEGLACVR